MKALTYRELGRRGRLGNQLWAIASTVGVARTLEVPARFDPDWAYRPFFSCPDEWFSDSWRQAKDVSRVISGNHWERTYVQSFDRWRHVEDEIRAAFGPSPRAVAILEAIGQPPDDAVAVHVRRTDYLDYGPDYFPLPDAGWYEQAAVFVSGASGISGVPFHVYGDDLDWAADNLPWAEPKRYGQGELTDFADLFQIARYRHHIISNSSYAWWAAWLSGDEQAVYPAEWFGPAIKAAWTQNMNEGWVGL